MKQFFQPLLPGAISILLLSSGFSGCGTKSKQMEHTEIASPVIAPDTPYDQYPVYEGDDLGMTYSSENTFFRVYAPTASTCKLRIYEAGDGEILRDSMEMSRGVNGTFYYSLQGDHQGKYYTYQAEIEGKWMNEVPDPYAIAVGVNGHRSMIADLSALQPAGWDNDKGIRNANFAENILYELHVRDFTISPNSGAKHKGKFLGIAETGTQNDQGQATGLDHLKELGITHIHLLPSFDHQSIDETRLDEPQYNWGYDPLNYNVPEGSYSTDPYHGEVRVSEFRKMVKTLHENGIGVILDVVYNHTGATENSIFNQLVPGYYYRHNEDGSFSNASGCGNETASERPMMRKYMIESIRHWVNIYHIDGFRFDLMGIHDIETMNQIRAAADEIDPDIFIYGEGWTAGGSPLAEEARAVKKNTHKLNRIAAFCDDMRDGLKGHWADKKDNGWVSGKRGMTESLKFGLLGAIQVPDSMNHKILNYEQVNYSQAGWAKEPTQCINYVACHDDLCLRDKLVESTEGKSEAEIVRMHRLANGLVFLGQGIPFLHSGAEMFRTKQGDHNSYKSPDSINQIDWSWKDTYSDHFNWYKSLISMRKDHPAFMLGSTEKVVKHVRFPRIPSYTEQPFAMTISGVPGDSWQEIQVIANAGTSPFPIPESGKWKIGFDESGYYKNGKPDVPEGNIYVPGQGLIVLFRNQPE